MKARSIAVFGGSFNPPHVGHQMVALYVLATQPVDELWWVPCHRHPFAKDLAPFAHRLAMCRLAAATLGERCRVSDIEATLDDGRTLVLLEALGAQLGAEVGLRLVIGADILAEEQSWYRWDDVRALAPPIVIGRRGYPGASPSGVELPEVSSTDVRARLGRGESVADRVPRTVRAYIEQHGLYR